ncbi:MAG: porphobilinogen synthase, partial [Pseudomonadota bacterium]
MNDFLAGAFPRTRLRRARAADWRRRLVQETQISVNDLIWPIFLIEGRNHREPVGAMPGV